MIETFSQLGIALGLGLLVGLQRERTDARLAGFRTFPLVTLLGALCGLLGTGSGGWILAAGAGALGLVILAGNLPLLHRREDQPGITTEVALLVMYAVGACLTTGRPAIAIATCGAVAVLLHLKPQMHSWAAKIADRDFRAMMQFTLISLVILPVLPNREFGPFAVLNPFEIWLMVVLIVGVSLTGYVLYKLVGVRGGAWASGVLGGLISSTATTVSFARRAKTVPESSALASFVILIASATVFLRIALLMALTDGQLFHLALGPCLAMFGALALTGLAQLKSPKFEPAYIAEQTNPTELRSALLFGLLYAAVLLGGAAAHRYFGAGGLYTVAMISGLTDMDAITLSVAHLVARSSVDPETGWRLVTVAAVTNLGFKLAVVASLGNRRVLGKVAIGFCSAGIVAAAFFALS
jgi:uncharacterized membrane protein (DUF4010 family)